MRLQRYSFHKKEDVRYACPVGRVRALEQRLLDRNFFLRLCEADSYMTVLKELKDRGYQEAFNSIDTASIRPEDITRAEIARISGIINELTLDPAVTDCFLIRQDMANLKSFLKQEKAGNRQASPVFPSGILIDTSTGLAAYMNKGFKMRFFEVPEKIISEKDPHMIDIEVDRQYFSMVLGKMEDVDFAGNFFKHEIDLNNIMTFIRFKDMDYNEEVLAGALIHGGWLEEKMFIDLYPGSFEGFIEANRNGCYTDVFQKGFRRRADKGDGYFEVHCTDWLTRYMKKALTITFGIEPVIAYWWARNIELKNINNILVGKYYDVSEPDIKDRLYDTYV